MIRLKIWELTWPALQNFAEMEIKFSQLKNCSMRKGPVLPETEYLGKLQRFNKGKQNE